MNEATHQSETGTAHPAWLTVGVRFVAWVLEIILFGVAIVGLIPLPSSAVGMAWDPPSRSTVLTSCGFFSASLLIATLSRRERWPGLIVKTMIFALFAAVLCDTTSRMAIRINNSIPDVITK